MITEFVESLLTPAPRWAKRMGFLDEAIAIEARARRCQEAWAPHQRETKDAVLDAVSACENFRTALIVGSGACLDIPLPELATIFQRVMLVDIVHPLKSGKHGWDNVVQVVMDITGQMEALYHHPNVLPEMSVPVSFHDDTDIDCVLSVNLASQLPIMPLKYLEQKRSHNEDELERFTENLLAAHFTWLSGFQCSTALICDKTWERLDASGKVVEVNDPLYGHLSQKTTREWDWDVAPIHETGTEFSRRNRVGYWSNFFFERSENLTARHQVNLNGTSIEGL